MIQDRGKLEAMPQLCLSPRGKGQKAQLWYCFDVLISGLMMQSESTGQPDSARDTYIVQRRSGVLAPKATDEADIICVANA